MTAIIDYGMGNIHSVQKALELSGEKVILTNRAQDILSSDKAVLPGVGAFAEAMLELEKQGLLPSLKEYIKSKRPFLGICLGMQLLFESSQEADKTKGLGLLKGTVRRFKAGCGLKIPHMGWNQLKIKNNSCPLLTDIPDNAYLYFCHSYYACPRQGEITAASSDYGEEFSCVVWQDNIFGVQFHPEKSQKTGLKIIENFIKLC